MKKAYSVLFIYLASLLVFSLIFSGMGFSKAVFPFLDQKIQITPMMIVAIVGGIIALKYTLSVASFRMFLTVYAALWAIRLFVLFIGNQIGQISFSSKHFNIDYIIANYYASVSRLDTPLPFIIYWFINHVFSKQGKNTGDTEKKEASN